MSKEKYKQHIPFRNWKNIWGMIAVFIGLTAVFVAGALLGVLSTNVVSIVSPLFFGLYVLTIYETIVLFREGFNVREDNTLVVCKNKDGYYEIIHVEHLVKVIVCNGALIPITEDKKFYRNVCIGFVLDDGRTKCRVMSVVTQRQIDRLRKALNVSEAK